MITILLQTLDVSVKEDLKIGEYVTSVLATDADTNHLLHYSIVWQQSEARTQTGQLVKLAIWKVKYIRLVRLDLECS